MRVLHIGNYLRREVPGGVEVLAETLARTLAEGGTKIHLAAFTFGPPNEEHPTPNLTVTALRCPFRIFTMGVPSPREVCRLWRAVGQAQLVMAYFPSPVGTLLGALFSKLRAKPLIVAIMAHLAMDPASKGRGLAYRFASWLVNALALRWAVGGADLLLEPSPGYLELNRYTAGHRGKTILLPLAADTEMFHPGIPQGHIRRKHGIQGQVILFVGTLRPTHLGKGLPVLMKAMTHLVHDGKRNDIWLVVVADGELEGYFHHLAEDLNIAHRFVHARGVPRTEVPLYFRDADVFVLPSVWLEAFGLVLAEAMASGTPVIGSRIGGIPYVVGDAGLLVEPGDGRALAAALLKVLDDEALARKLGARGRERVLREFTWARTAARTLEAYDRLLKNSEYQP